MKSIHDTMRERFSTMMALAVTVALIFLVVFGACAVPALTTPAADTSPGSAPVTSPDKPATSKEGSEGKWEKLVTLARQEGTVRIYTSLAPQTATAVNKAFQAKYGINLEFISGRPPDLTQKVLFERRAGLYLADVFIGGGTFQVTLLKPNGLLDPIGPALILPEVADATAWKDGKIPFFDKDRTAIGFAASYRRYISRNAEMVKADDISSFRDLLKPQWKSKIVLDDPAMGAGGLFWITLLKEHIWGLEETRSYLQALQRQDIALSRDSRLQVEWLARGKYPLAIASKMDTVLEFARAGAPVASVEKVEGGLITRGGGGVALASQAAHPSAAVVFVNWLLGKEGQTVFSRADLLPSARVDVSLEGFDPALFPSSVEKVYEEDDKFILASREMLAVFNEIFSLGGK